MFFNIVRGDSPTRETLREGYGIFDFFSTDNRHFYSCQALAKNIYILLCLVTQASKGKKT